MWENPSQTSICVLRIFKGATHGATGFMSPNCCMCCSFPSLSRWFYTGLLWCEGSITLLFDSSWHIAMDEPTLCAWSQCCSGIRPCRYPRSHHCRWVDIRCWSMIVYSIDIPILSYSPSGMYGRENRPVFEFVRLLAWFTWAYFTTSIREWACVSMCIHALSCWTSGWGCHEMLICEESIHCGCIPVILSDEYEVAFQHVIAAWHAFVTSWGRAMHASCMFLLSCSFYRVLSQMLLLLIFALLIAVLISTVW